MAVPDTVMTDLRAISDSAAVADHPQVETFYNIAVSTVNTVPWGALATWALALMTAHLCLTYPANSSHIDRLPIETVPGGEGAVKYATINVHLRDSSLRTTAPGRQYLDLRKRTVRPSYSPVA